MMQLREVPGFAPVVDGLSWAISAFDNKDLAFAIALGILVLAFVVFIFLHFFRHWRWVKPIRRLVNALKKLQDSDDDAETRLIQADRLFEGKNHLSKLWREYRNQLIDNQKASGYVNLIDPRPWFSLESLPGRGYEHWCSTWAGVFLTIGLLFTFIGLSAALIKVGGIDGADSSAMKAAITGILGVSSAKFITSIAGLLAYIFFSLITRRYQASQQTAAHELADAIQHLSVPLTPESLLYQQNEKASQQLTCMERLTDDLAIAIDTKLEQRLKMLSSDFGVHMGSMQKDLPVETAKPIVEAIEKMSQNVAAEFTKQVRQTAGGEIDTLITRLESVAKTLKDLNGGIGNAGVTFGEDIGKAAKILSDAAKNMGAGIDTQTDDLSRKLDQFGGKLDSILTSFGKVPENIDKAFKETLDNLRLAIDELVGQMKEGGQTGGSALTKGGQDAGKELMEAVVRSGTEFDRQVAEASKQLVTQFTGAQAILQTAITDLANRLSTVESSLKILPGAVATQVQQLNTAGQSFQTAGQTVIAVSGALQQTVRPLQQTSAAITSGVGELLQGVNTIRMVQEKTSKAIDAALDALIKAAKTAENTFNTHEGRFGRIDTDLANALENLRGGVDQVANATQKTFADYDHHITSAVNSLGGILLELRNLVGDLDAFVEKMFKARQA